MDSKFTRNYPLYSFGIVEKFPLFPVFPDSFVDEEKVIMDKLTLKSPTGESEIAYFKAAELKLLRKYDSGIWLIIDPLEGFVRDMPSYIKKENYSATQVIDVGN